MPSNAVHFVEPQRDSVLQPRVARNELPWVRGPVKNNPERVVAVGGERRRNPVGVENILNG